MNAPDRKLADLRINPEWAKLPLFDRSKWQRVRFGDVVENINDTCDPVEDGIERFIGLEHLEPGSLYVRSWGNVSDGTTFSRRCMRGQVLFGKRRAYQRKVAVAGFDAVVSGDIYVLAPKNEQLLMELLPYICNSDRFFEFAVGTSAGSLSPRTNWSSLAAFEVDLPPLDQQRRIARILLAIDKVFDDYRRALSALHTCFRLERDFTVGGKQASPSSATSFEPLPRNWKWCSIDDMVSFIGGAQPPRDTFEYKPTQDNIRLIQIRDYKSDEFMAYIPRERARRFCDVDDVMIGRYGPPIFQILRGLKGSYNVALIKALPKEGLSKSYLFHFLKQTPLFEMIDHLSQRSSGQTGIDMEALKKYPMPLPPLQEQDKLVERFDDFEALIAAMKGQMGKLREIMSFLVA